MTHPINWNIKTYQTLASTQDTLKAMIVSGEAEEGTLIHALEQTSGYGRHGRKWKSASGNLSFSFMLSPQVSLAQKSTLSLIAGIALTHAIQSILALQSVDDIILKWPNDIMLNGEKCAGILLENIEDHLIIGIGVNISCAPIEGSTCLFENQKKPPITKEALLDRFLTEFGDLYPVWIEKGFCGFKSDYMRLSYKKGTNVCVKLPSNNIEGLFHGVDEDGSMLILCKDTKKLQKITAGEVFFV